MLDEAIDAEDMPQGNPSVALFHRRMVRLEQISIELRHLYHDYAESLIAERRAKAELYLTNSTDASHGAKEGYASHKAVENIVESIKLKGLVSRLEEERDFIRFAIEHDQGF